MGLQDRRNGDWNRYPHPEWSLDFPALSWHVRQPDTCWHHKPSIIQHSAIIKPSSKKGSSIRSICWPRQPKLETWCWLKLTLGRRLKGMYTYVKGKWRDRIPANATPFGSFRAPLSKTRVLSRTLIPRLSAPGRVKQSTIRLRLAVSIVIP